MTSHLKVPGMVPPGGGSSRRSPHLDRRDCGAAAQRQRSFGPLATRKSNFVEVDLPKLTQINTFCVKAGRNNLIQSPLKVELHKIEHRFLAMACFESPEHPLKCCDIAESKF